MHPRHRHGQSRLSQRHTLSLPHFTDGETGLGDVNDPRRPSCFLGRVVSELKSRADPLRATNFVTNAQPPVSPPASRELGVLVTPS